MIPQLTWNKGQFWRLHSRKHLKAFGHCLRVGRTEGLTNPFEEPKRMVEVRSLSIGEEP